MNKNCLLCGVGGQGVVLASKLIAYAAMEKGMEVRTSETIGMAQRGGSVVSHVRLGQKIYSPMIPKGSADLIIAFEPAEAVRNLAYLKEDGAVIVNQKAVQPVTAILTENNYKAEEMITYLKQHIKRLYVVDGEEICHKSGSAKVLNVALLGAAIRSETLDISMEEMKIQIEKNVKSKFIEMNLKALELADTGFVK